MPRHTRLLALHAIALIPIGMLCGCNKPEEAAPLLMAEKNYSAPLPPGRIA